MNIAMIGFGNHAQQVMFRAFNESRAELSLIASESFPRDNFQEAVPVVPDYDQALSRPDVDAAYIAVANNAHFDLSLRALRAGKHVLCEKPLTTKREQAESLVKESKTQNLQLMEAFMYRFHPQHAEVWRLLRSGEIGKPLHMDIRFHYMLEDEANIRLRPETEGGALNDVGCYGIDCARFLFGADPSEVFAVSEYEDGVDNKTSLLLRFSEGRSAHILCGTKLRRENRYSILGTKGEIEVGSAFHVPRNKKTSIVIRKNSGEKDQLSIPAANQYVIMLDKFCDLCEGKPLSSQLYGNGLANSTILEAAHVSASRGGAISI